MGLFCTVSKIDGDFSQKLPKFSYPMYFDGVPLGIGYWHKRLEKNGMMGIPDSPKTFTIGFAFRYNTGM